jgi:hypothetical protein
MIPTVMTGATQVVGVASQMAEQRGTLFVSVVCDCAPVIRKAREEQQRSQFRLLSEESQKRRKWPFPPEPDLA